MKNLRRNSSASSKPFSFNYFCVLSEHWHDTRNLFRYCPGLGYNRLIQSDKMHRSAVRRQHAGRGDTPWTLTEPTLNIACISVADVTDGLFLTHSITICASESLSGELSFEIISSSSDEEKTFTCASYYTLLSLDLVTCSEGTR